MRTSFILLLLLWCTTLQAQQKNTADSTTNSSLSTQAVAPYVEPYPYPHGKKLILGFRASYLVSGYRGSTDSNVRPVHSLGIGAFASVHLFRRIYLQPELNLEQLGVRHEERVQLETKEVDVKTQVNNKYLYIPILLKGYLPRVKGLALYAGPQLGVLLQSRTRMEISGSPVQKQNTASGFNNTVLGGLAGVCYELDDGILLSLRYQTDFTDILTHTSPNQPQGKRYNEVIKFSVGIGL